MIPLLALAYRCAQEVLRGLVFTDMRLGWSVDLRFRDSWAIPPLWADHEFRYLFSIGILNFLVGLALGLILRRLLFARPLAADHWSQAKYVLLGSTVCLYCIALLFPGDSSITVATQSGLVSDFVYSQHSLWFWLFAAFGITALIIHWHGANVRLPIAFSVGYALYQMAGSNWFPLLRFGLCVGAGYWLAGRAPDVPISDERFANPRWFRSSTVLILLLEAFAPQWFPRFSLEWAGYSQVLSGLLVGMVLFGLGQLAECHESVGTTSFDTGIWA